MIDPLHYISQGSTAGEQLTHIENACRAGVTWVQLRMKKQPAEVVADVARQARTLCTRYGARLIINDHPVVALAVGADGVHLGKEDMPVSEARQLLGPSLIIGGTANTYEDIVAHVQAGADYVGLGPFRFTSTKEKLSPILGLAGYQRIFQKLREGGISIPVVGIGGIGLDDVEPLLQIGLSGIAASALITHAPHRRELVGRINDILNNHTHVNHC